MTFELTQLAVYVAVPLLVALAAAWAGEWAIDRYRNGREHDGS